jgi:dipeptidyl aminopeptidase/acylaminoacyl peptidase
MSLFFNTKKIFCCIYNFRVLNLILLLFAYTLSGQVKLKKNITVSDYSKWGTLMNQSLSKKGNWASYCMKYDDAPDTLFVKSVENKISFQFPNANEGMFINEKLFIFLDKARSLHSLDLEKGTLIKLDSIQKYSVSADNRYLITLEQNKKENLLSVRNFEGKILEMIVGVKEFKMNNFGNALVGFIDNQEIKSILLIKLGVVISKFKILEGRQEIYSNLTWSESSGSFAFLAQNSKQNQNKLFHYLVKHNKLSEFMPQSTEDFPEGFQVSAIPNTLTISPDDSSLIFNISKTLKSEILDPVQIWNTNDAVVYSEKVHSGELDNTLITVSWQPQNARFLKITDKHRPYCTLNSSKDFALVFGFNKGKPQYGENRKVDYYVTDLRKGSQHLLLEDHLMGLHNTSMSPKGTYIAYLRNNEWWVYDFKTKVKIKLANTDSRNFENIEYAQEKKSYGIGGWSSDEKYILLYDRFDIWKASIDGKKTSKITRGSEKKIKFRTVPDDKKVFFPNSGNIGQEVDLDKPITLSATGENQTGFFLLSPRGELKEISYGKSLHSKISKSINTDKFIYITQSYDSPPSLVYLNPNTQEKKLVFQSNMHHFNYNWGRQEFIKYKNSANEELNGTLYYPFNYDATSKYPMLVFVYEELSYRNLYYTNPSRYNLTGFNLSSLTAAGYFVLMPDIKYKIGDTGFSAVDCVLAATKKVIESGIIDKERIALMGQSFGGYETNFIVTQTNLFKTAISGVSIFDLERMYLSISESAGKPELWRFESQQWRMGTSLFEGRENYERNSPSTYVESINTPMLIWSGAEDRQVNPDQSVALYLALRRLEKKGILLMYPTESHSLMLKKSQIDLYNRLNDWLAFYLKNEPPTDWIKKGLQ